MGGARATYRLTATGQTARDAEGVKVPVDYRRILALLRADTHYDVIRGALRRYPDKLISDWLAELEEIGYIETVQDEAFFDLDFTRAPAPSASEAPMPEEDAKLIEAQAKTAETALAKAGAWIAEDRLVNRPALIRVPAEATVLVVEDDPDQLALADLRVSMAGYKVRVARNARELLDDLRTQPRPDILLLDVMLPDGNGFDILGKLRSHPKFALLPVAMLTAKDDPHEIARGLGLGADGYITKPYSKNILADTIGRILGMR